MQTLKEVKRSVFIGESRKTRVRRERRERAAMRKFKRQQDLNKLFAEGNTAQRKRKKTTDAIVSYSDYIVTDKDGNILTNEWGEALIGTNARKGPSGRTRLGKSETIGCSELQEAQARDAYYLLVDVNKLSLAQAGLQCTTQKVHDGKTVSVDTIDSQHAINKGLQSIAGTTLVKPISAWKGNPVKRRNHMGRNRVKVEKLSPDNPRVVQDTPKPIPTVLTRDHEARLEIKERKVHKPIYRDKGKTGSDLQDLIMKKK